MSSKKIQLDGVGYITVTKRRGQKTLRVSVNGAVVRVSQPAWLPFSAGESFARSRINWILQNIQTPKTYQDGQSIGQFHTLRLLNGPKNSCKTVETIVNVSLAVPADSQESQEYIAKCIAKTLRSQAEEFLPKRTATLAEYGGFSFSSVSVKQLKRRWGSCNSKRDIVYNLHLMELNPEQIDYVILHELTHTEHMNHSTNFWTRLDSIGGRFLYTCITGRQILRPFQYTSPNS